MIRNLINIVTICIVLFGGGLCHAELSEDQAFNLQVQVEKQHLEFYWEIAPGHYLYKAQISLVDTNNVSLLQDDTLPAGKTINDPNIGSYDVYEKKLLFSIPWHKANAETYQLLLHYQGCAKDGFCYLPISKEITVTGDQVSIKESSFEDFPVNSAADRLANVISDRFLPITLIVFFFLGILLSFTPCVLPMIPLVVNLIIGPKPISTRRALILSGSYVIGMATSYTVAGVIAGMLGATLQAWLQQPVVIVLLSIFLVLLALSQFEIIHISLPHFNKRLHHWGAKQLQGSVIGAFVLGILAALIVSPCITPPLIGALTYISQHGNPLIGGLTLMSLGLGMGVPLIIVALLSSFILPAAGPWMNLVKSLAGLALLGLAIWLMDRIVPPYITLILWGALCIITAVFLKAFEPLKNPRRTTRIIKAFGIVLAIYGAALIINAINKQFSSHPAEISTTSTPQSLAQWKNITTVSELQHALDAAKAKQQITLLEVYANWCTSCKKIEATVFSNQQVLKQLEQYNLLRIDMTNIDPKQDALLNLLEIYGPPVIMFFNSSGVEIKNKRIVGEINAHEFLKTLGSL